MSCLCVSLHATSSIWLKTFLRSCPNLRYLIISMLRLCLNPHLIYLPFLDQTKMISEEMSFPFVPQCVLSSLEYVDFKVRILGLTAEMKLIRYFIENSAFLKRLTLPIGVIATYIEFGDDKAASAATLYVAAETDAATIFCAPSLT
ncbi:unnamed protein product [Brassica oleracea]